MKRVVKRNGMISIGVAVLLLLISVTASNAQSPYIAVYFDSLLTEQTADCPGTGLDTVYVGAKNFDTFFTAVEYKINYSPSLTWISDLDTPPVTIGGTPTGISIGFGIPQNGFDPNGILLHRVLVFWTCTGCSAGNTDEEVSVVGHPFSGKIQAVDWPAGEFFEPIGGTSLICPSAAALSLSIGVLQNPYLTSFLDIYLVGSTPLIPSDVVVTVDGNPLGMNRINDADEIWKGDYELSGPGGTVVIDACATDVNNTSDCTGTSFSASLIRPLANATLRSPDGRFNVRIDKSNIRSEGYMLVIPGSNSVDEDEAGALGAPKQGDVTLPSFTVSPSTLVNNGDVTVEFSYKDLALPDGLELSQLFIEHVGQGALDSHIDVESGVVRATAAGLGKFQLSTGLPGTSRLADPRFVMVFQNYPNPFNPVTTIPFEVQTRQHVRVAVFDVSGRLINTLVDEDVTPGLSRVIWNARSQHGDEVASGVYFVQVKTAYQTVTRKLVLIR